LAISCAQPSVERSVSIRGRASTFLAPRHQSIQVYACRFAKGQRASRIPFAGRRAPTWKAQAFGYFQDMHRASVSELGLKSGCSRPLCGTESLSSAARHWLLIPETVTLPSKLAGAKAPATRFPWEIYGCLDCRQHLRRKTPAPEGRVQVPTVMLFGTLCTA
jgi:hypothetical protein